MLHLFRMLAWQQEVHKNISIDDDHNRPSSLAARRSSSVTKTVEMFLRSGRTLARNVVGSTDLLRNTFSRQTMTSLLTLCRWRVALCLSCSYKSSGIFLIEGCHGNFSQRGLPYGTKMATYDKRLSRSRERYRPKTSNTP